MATRFSITSTRPPRTTESTKTSASIIWSSAPRGRRKDALWTVEAECGPEQQVARFTCDFLFICSGYYSYVEGYTPVFPGSQRFAGQLVHPQKWPEDLAYADKRVIVIGSGATAVTLGARDGEDSGPSDHAAALAHLRGRASRARRACQFFAASFPRNAGVQSGALAKHFIRHLFLRPLQTQSGAGEEMDSRSRQGSLGTRTTTSVRISLRATIPGISACAWYPTEICSNQSKQAKPPSSPMKSTPSPRKASNCAAARKLQGDIIVTATGLESRRARQHSNQRRWPPHRSGQYAQLQGHDVRRDPESGLNLRLHQCVMDTEERIDLRLHLPRAESHAGERL